MNYLRLAVLLCSLLPLCNAFCYGKAAKLGLGFTGATRCQDDTDKTWHEVGSSWRNSDCMDCTCGQCCSSYSIPRQFPHDCESVFDSKACVYRVHKKNNPAVECPIFGAVGK